MIHIIVGPPCAGKSTYVRENAKDGDLRVDYDLIAQALGATNSHAAEGLVKQAAFDAREGAIKTALKDAEAESWIIHTSPSAEHIKMYEEAGAEFVKLDPGKDVCIERATHDERPQNTFDGIEKWYSAKKSKGGTTMKVKSFNVKYRDDGNGSIEGYASTWIREPDSYGDVVKEGAFTKTLAERWNGGRGIPLLWAHQMDQLESFIGKADANEDDKGLHFVAQFDDTEEAQRVRELYKDGRLKSFSFAYDTLDWAPIELEDGRKANELRELDLFEISCVTVPANADATVVDIKAAEDTETKSGRRNSAKDLDTMAEIESHLTEAMNGLKKLKEVVDDTESEGEDEAKTNEASEESEQSNLEARKTAIVEFIKSMEE